jgi:hypothetical protein
MWLIACIWLSLTGCRFGFDEHSGSGSGGGGDDVVTPPMPGVAHVTVLGEDGEANVGQPIADAYVVAIETDGTTTTVRSAADGTADIDVFGNTAIHVARPLSGNQWALSSFRAINDGAHIVVGGEPPQALSSARSVTVNLPAFPMDYTEAWITGPRMCFPTSGHGTGVPTVVLAYDPRCEGQTVELFATSFNLFVPIGTVTLSDGMIVDRTTAAWLGLDKVHIQYTNVPADITAATAYVSFPTSAGDIIPLAENGDVPDAEHSVAFHLDIPPVVPGTQLIHVFESAAGVRIVYERIDSWGGNRIFDASMLAPAPAPAMINVGTNQVQWTITPAADADVYWSSTDITIGASVVHWNAFGPPGAQQVTFPALPAELTEIIPKASSSWSTPRVVLAGLSDFDYVSALEIVDRDIYWWWAQNMYLPPGSLSLTTSAVP